MKQRVQWETSERVFQFGGGERRGSKGVIQLPCSLDGELDITLRTEVVEADIPLLIGNMTLIRGLGIIDTPNMELVLLGKRLKLNETESGHFSLMVKVPRVEDERMAIIEDMLCLAINAMTEISETDHKKKQEANRDSRTMKKELDSLSKPDLALSEVSSSLVALPIQETHSDPNANDKLGIDYEMI